MAKPPNDRFPDHPPTPKQFLSHVTTRVDGSYRAHSIDPSNRMRTVGFLTAAGVFLAHVIDAQGHSSSATPGATKRFSQSDTKTTTNHADASAGGGKSDKTAGGGDTQHGGDKTDSVKGAKVAASKQSAMNITSGGTGRHTMKGEQTFTVEEGGLFHEVPSRQYGLFAKQGIELTTDENIHLKAKGSLGMGVDTETYLDSGTNISIKSQRGVITIRCGDGKTFIRMSPDKLVLGYGDFNSPATSGIQIDSSGVSIAGTVWLRDSKTGAHDASAVGIPTKIP